MELLILENNEDARLLAKKFSYFEVLGHWEFDDEKTKRLIIIIDGQKVSPKMSMITLWETNILDSDAFKELNVHRSELAEIRVVLINGN